MNFHKKCSSLANTQLFCLFFTSGKHYQLASFSHRVNSNVLLNVLSRVADERTLRALIGLLVGQHMLSEIVFPHEALVANVTREVPGPVGRLVLPQSRVLAEALAAELARVGRLLGVRSVVGQELGLVAQHLVAQAARTVLDVIVTVVLQTLGIVELLITNFALGGGYVCRSGRLVVAVGLQHGGRGSLGQKHPDWQVYGGEKLVFLPEQLVSRLLGEIA